MLVDIMPFLIPSFIALAFTFKAPCPSERLVGELLVLLSAQLVGFFSSWGPVAAAISDVNNLRATGCRFDLDEDAVRVLCWRVGLPRRWPAV